MRSLLEELSWRSHALRLARCNITALYNIQDTTHLLRSKMPLVLANLPVFTYRFICSKCLCTSWPYCLKELSLSGYFKVIEEESKSQMRLRNKISSPNSNSTLHQYLIPLPAPVFFVRRLTACRRPGKSAEEMEKVSSHASSFGQARTLSRGGGVSFPQ